ncbi:DUF1016 N-terminal domain-containing protein [Methanospirillum sp.]|uniref:DUF1016 N-terminal domain-containing protein n=1 Tax=Methanospirillum sp. TaxID=45200 RepID=UPI002B749476|nr:DUF1016 N-terminal domain-containing protein [Methanospirillum sp.]HOL40567.1 DUF1016 N-terminal domain-containing protein [Methanospirillum sp.]
MPPLIPSDYPTFLTELKTHIRQAQLKAALSVNKELILLYWKIGKDILTSQEKLGWGGPKSSTSYPRKKILKMPSSLIFRISCSNLG